MRELLNAGSWEVAARVAAAAPARTRVYETHAGGGQYDSLSIAGGWGRIHFTRNGSIHLPGDVIDMQQWRATLRQEQGARRLAAQIIAAMGWPDPQSPPEPHLIVYHVIARILAAKIASQSHWDALEQFEDTSGDVSGIRWPVPYPEMSQLPANEVWVICRNGEPVAWLWDGWAWTARGDRLNLVSRYDAGAGYDRIARWITRPPAGRSAPALPQVTTGGPQPIGVWPDP